MCGTSRRPGCALARRDRHGSEPLELRASMVLTIPPTSGALMTTGRSTALLLAGSFVLVAAGGATAGAEAGTPHWKTMVSVSGGKLQMCKEPTTRTGPWKVRVRVDGSHATRKVYAIAQVYKNKSKALDTFDAGPVTPGQLSDTGVIDLPRGQNYAVTGDIGDNTSGDSGLFTA